MIVFLIIVAVILWLLWKLILWLCEVFVSALPYIINTLLIILGVALVAGITWLFLPYKENEDNKKNRNRKKPEYNS